MAQQAQPPAAGFSFAVYGDSPVDISTCHTNPDKEAEARELMVKMFELVFPKNVAEVVVQKDVKFIYDRENSRAGREFIMLPFDTRHECNHPDTG